MSYDLYKPVELPVLRTVEDNKKWTEDVEKPKQVRL